MRRAAHHMLRPERRDRGYVCFRTFGSKRNGGRASKTPSTFKKAPVERNACAGWCAQPHAAHAGTVSRGAEGRTDLHPARLPTRHRSCHRQVRQVGPTAPRTPASKEAHTKQTLSATWRRNRPRAQDPRANVVGGPTCAPWPRRALHSLTPAQPTGEHGAPAPSPLQEQVADTLPQPRSLTQRGSKRKRCAHGSSNECLIGTSLTRDFKPSPSLL